MTILSIIKLQVCVAASVLLLALLTMTPAPASAHSYMDCVDWKFYDSNNRTWDNGYCNGYARRFPIDSLPFSHLDHDSPPRHYQQSLINPKDQLPCSNAGMSQDERMGSPISSAYSGYNAQGHKTGRMTFTKRGAELCIRWPAKNHALPGEKSHLVTIALSQANPTRDPTQREFLKNVVARLNFKNCTQNGIDRGAWPCGQCFTLPMSVQKGYHTLQWRWPLGEGANKTAFYTSCADILVR